jgi:hypothetical protein
MPWQIVKNEKGVTVPPPDQPGPGPLITALVEALSSLLETDIARSMIASVNVTHVTGSLMATLFTPELARAVAKAIVLKGNIINMAIGNGHTGAITFPLYTLEKLFPVPMEPEQPPTVIKVEISAKKVRFEEVRQFLIAVNDNFDSNDDKSVIDDVVALLQKKDDSTFVAYFKADSPFPAAMCELGSADHNSKTFSMTSPESAPAPSSYAQAAATPKKKKKTEGPTKAQSAAQLANKLFGSKEPSSGTPVKPAATRSPSIPTPIRSSSIPRLPPTGRKPSPAPAKVESTLEKLQEIMLVQAHRLDTVESSIATLVKALRNEQRPREENEAKRPKSTDEQSKASDSEASSTDANMNVDKNNHSQH